MDEMCQCPYGLNFIFTRVSCSDYDFRSYVSMPLRAKLHFYENGYQSLHITVIVSMPLRAKLHFYWKITNRLRKKSDVSMPLRAKLHFYFIMEKKRIFKSVVCQCPYGLNFIFTLGFKFSETWETCVNALTG